VNSATADINDTIGLVNRFTTSPAAAVPEPGTLALTGLGMLGLGVWLRRRKKSG
jgi:hypothetical protein